MYGYVWIFFVVGYMKVIYLMTKTILIKPPKKKYFKFLSDFFQPPYTGSVYEVFDP